MNLLDSPILLQLAINQGQNIQNTVHQFCKQHQVLQHQTEIIRVIRDKLRSEDKPFQVPSSETRPNNQENECTFRPKKSNVSGRGVIINSKANVYERLSLRSKQVQQSDHDDDVSCTFKPSINHRSRLIAQKISKKVEAPVLQETSSYYCDFETFHADEECLRVGALAAKQPLEKFMLLHCIFILLDEDDDNLISQGEVNWTLLDANLAKILSQLLINFNSQDDITFSQIVEELIIRNQFNECCEIIVDQNIYRNYVTQDLLQSVRAGRFSKHVTLSEFVQQFKQQTHILDHMGRVPSKYKNLILESLRR